MVEAATFAIIQVAKWTFRFGFIMAGITTFIIVLNIAFSMVFVALNFGVVGDVLHLIQLWLPFNLNVLIAWVLTTSVAYVAYRLAVISIAYMNRLISN